MGIQPTSLLYENVCYKGVIFLYICEFSVVAFVWFKIYKQLLACVC